jgi:hypothetical protein
MVPPLEEGEEKEDERYGLAAGVPGRGGASAILSGLLLAYVAKLTIDRQGLGGMEAPVGGLFRGGLLNGRLAVLAVTSPRGCVCIAFGPNRLIPAGLCFGWDAGRVVYVPISASSTPYSYLSMRMYIHPSTCEREICLETGGMEPAKKRQNILR